MRLDREDRVRSAIIVAGLIGIKPHVIMILVNSTYSQGRGAAYPTGDSLGYKYAWSPINTSFERIVTHETGHAFGGLADEYWNRGWEAPNMTENKNPITVKWSSWVGYDDVWVDSNIGKYRLSPSGTAWYIPTSSGSGGICHMNNHITYDFCSVCSTHLISKMSNISGETGYIYNYLPGGNAEIAGLGAIYGHLNGNPKGKIIIPARIDGKTVTAISADAFLGRPGISDVKIPDTVKRVGENAFSTTRIWFNAPDNNVVYADKWVIGYKGIITNSSGKLNFRSSDPPVGIADMALYQVSGLKEAILPISMTNVGNCAFYDNVAFERIWIPSSVKRIDSFGFISCPSLTIYAQATNKPGEWDNYWNPNNRPVIWGSPSI